MTDKLPKKELEAARAMLTRMAQNDWQAILGSTTWVECRRKEIQASLRTIDKQIAHIDRYLIGQPWRNESRARNRRSEKQRLLRKKAELVAEFMGL